MLYRIFLTILLLTALGGPTAAQESPAGLDSALQEARGISADLGARLRSVLGKAIKENGYVGAIAVCSTKAQQISEEYSSSAGRYVRRVSLGFRNPKDRPDTYETRKLQQFDQLNRSKSLKSEYYEVVREDGQRVLRYMKPLPTASVCLNCHGSAAEIPPEVQTVLKEKYPKDRATGYHVGDIRGAVSVKIILPAKSD